jgi:hypothetical protein
LDDTKKLQQNNRHKMAVIVPHRGRDEMLNKFLPALFNFLKVLTKSTLHLLRRDPVIVVVGEAF